MMMDAFRHIMDASQGTSIPKQLHNKKCDGIHREAKADHMCKHVRQFEFRRVHTDPYKALSKLGEAANNATD